MHACAHVYNLVLEGTDDHVPLVNGVGCVSLGHGLTNSNPTLIPNPNPNPNQVRLARPRPHKP